MITTTTTIIPIKFGVSKGRTLYSRISAHSCQHWLIFPLLRIKTLKKFNFECTCKQHTLVSRLSSTNSICYVPSDGVTQTSKTRWWLWGASSSRGQEHVDCVRITRHASCLRAQTLAQRLSLNVSAGTYEPCALGRAPVAQPQVPNQAVPVSRSVQGGREVPISWCCCGDSVSWHRTGTRDQAQCQC